MDVLVQIDAWDPVASAAVTLYASSIDDDRVCHLNGVTWWPAIARLPTLGYDFFGGDFDSSKIQAPASGLTMAIEPWPNFPRYIFANAAIQLWTGNAGDAWGSWTQRFSGRVSAQPQISDGIAELTFGVDARWLDAPLLPTYAGTGGAEGLAAQKGQAKPLAIGAPRFIAGVMVDQVNVVFQLNSAGPIQDVEVAFDQLTRFPASVGDYPSYALLVAASIPAGYFATSKAAGMARHGAPLAGQQCYHVQGDNGGPDGWARLPGEVIRRIAQLSGGTGKINDASLDALDAARPWQLSLYADQQTTARDLVQRIAVSVNAVAGVTWMGQLFAAAVPKPQPVNIYYGTTRPIYGGTNAMFNGPAVIGGSQLTLQADGSDLPPIADVDQVPIDAPFWRLALSAERTWTVHSPSEVQT